QDSFCRCQDAIVQAAAPNAVELTVYKLDTGIAHVEAVAKHEGALAVNSNQAARDGNEAMYFLYVAPDKLEDLKLRLITKDSNVLSYRSFSYIPSNDGLQGGGNGGGGFGGGRAGGYGL